MDGEQVDIMSNYMWGGPLTKTKRRAKNNVGFCMLLLKGALRIIPERHVFSFQPKEAAPVNFARTRRICILWHPQRPRCQSLSDGYAFGRFART